jgi:hypothetical protein
VRLEVVREFDAITEREFTLDGIVIGRFLNWRRFRFCMDCVGLKLRLLAIFIVKPTVCPVRMAFA